MKKCSGCAYAQEVGDQKISPDFLVEGIICGKLLEGKKCPKKFNLTQHAGSPEQIAEGLVEPSAEEKKMITSLLDFVNIPSKEEMAERAEKLAQISYQSGCNSAMIEGAPYFLAPLEVALMRRGIIPFYAFSRRESVDEVQSDGSVRKVTVFRHAGWVRGYWVSEYV